MHRAVGQQLSVGLRDGVGGELFRADLQSVRVGSPGTSSGVTFGVVVPSLFSPHWLYPQLKMAARLGPTARVAAGAAGATEAVRAAAAGATVPAMAATATAAMVIPLAPRGVLPPVVRTAILAFCLLAAGRGGMPHGRPVVLAGLWQ